jgi:hypothetical protein
MRGALFLARHVSGHPLATSSGPEKELGTTLLIGGQRYRAGASKLLDFCNSQSAGGEFGQDELMCRNMERSAMLRAAEALRRTARIAW